MSQLHKAAQQALEALESDEQAIECLRFIRCHKDRHSLPREWLTKTDEIIGYWDDVPAQVKRGLTRTALKAALAEPVQEPVAWYLPSPDGDDSIFRDHRTVIACDGNKWEGFVPLYSALLQRPAEPMQEPDQIRNDFEQRMIGIGASPTALSRLKSGEYLSPSIQAAWDAEKKKYTAPPQRKPLTQEQMERAYREIWRDASDDFGPTAMDWIEAGIRYAERAHGIGGDA